VRRPEIDRIAVQGWIALFGGQVSVPGFRQSSVAQVAQAVPAGLVGDPDA
jgi:hypothetical protein